MIWSTGNTKSFLNLEEFSLKYNNNISLVFKESCFVMYSHNTSWLNEIPFLKWKSETTMSNVCQKLLSRIAMQKICIKRMALVPNNSKLFSQCSGFKVTKYIQKV